MTVSSLAEEWLRSGLSRRALLIAGAATAASVPFLGLEGCSVITPDRHSFVMAIAQTTLPDTRTRGAGTAENVDFILAALDAGLFGANPMQLEILARHLEQAVGGDFAGKSKPVQFAALDRLDRVTFSHSPPAPTSQEQTLMDRVAVTSSVGAPKPPTPRDAWKTIKKLILTAYYTSEEGASHELTYDLSPGEFKADIPFSEVPKAMSNDWLSVIMR